MVRAVRDQLTPQRMRFLIASGLSFGLMAGITAAFEELGILPADVAYAVAIAITVTVNFFLYRYYIFPRTDKPILMQAAQFVSSVILFRIAELVAFSLLYRALGVHYAITLVIVLGSSFVCKYIFMGRFVFRAAPLSTDPGAEPSTSAAPNSGGAG